MPKLPIAVLISGGGTTLKNLLAVHESGRLDVEFRLVVSSRKTAAGLEFARQSGITTEVIRRRDFQTPAEHSQAMFNACRAAGVELVVMGGYLEHLLIADDFANRVVNIHPSLIPSFSGHGYYGLRVHQAAIDYGVKLSGCTVHFVDNEFDHGPIIVQRACHVLPADSAQDLAARVFDLECQLYPEAIQAIATGKVQLDGRRVLVAGPSGNQH
ncbi:MAG TPA: phosphoribosylglycinamide formyltransferase [Planctomycetaceae bacterium]|nr:phosphoribosylglycinamide formyltransferase [Planctomycetaceae bacterium]